MVRSSGGLGTCANTCHLRVGLKSTEVMQSRLEGRLVPKIRTIKVAKEGNSFGFPSALAQFDIPGPKKGAECRRQRRLIGGMLCLGVFAPLESSVDSKNWQYRTGLPKIAAWFTLDKVDRGDRGYLRDGLR